MSRLRRLVLSDFFFLTVKLLPWRRSLDEVECALLAQRLSFSPCHDPRFWALIAVAACSQKVDVCHINDRRL